MHQLRGPQFGRSDVGSITMSRYASPIITISNKLNCLIDHIVVFNHFKRQDVIVMLQFVQKLMDVKCLSDCLCRKTLSTNR